METKHVVIVGGGFAGIKAAKTLGNKKGVRVTLVDRRNHHLFQPLLYQVATAGLSPAEISEPIRGILSKYRNVMVILDNVQELNLNQKTIATETGNVSYDYLILACGAKHSYFNHPEWEEYAPGLKTLEQAIEIRRRILVAFEKAEKEPDPVKQKQHLTFIIVGAGPTGAELAGAIAEISNQTLKKDFRNIDSRNTEVLLVEAGPRVLPSFHEELSQRAVRDLQDLGVQIRTNTKVTDIQQECVRFGQETVKASTILWAAGVQPSSLNESLGAPLDRQGRVIVEKDLSLPGHPEVFVLGDQASFLTDEGVALPGLASVAMQQGVYAAKKILNDLSGKTSHPFKYRDKGQMATIGRKKALAQIDSFRFGGTFAWFLWLFVHVYFLIGFKNKVFVMWQWAYAYLTLKRGARLITDTEWRSSASSSGKRRSHNSQAENTYSKPPTVPLR